MELWSINLSQSRRVSRVELRATSSAVEPQELEGEEKC